MMFKLVLVKTKKEKKLFLNFPKTLYKNDFLTQNIKLEKEILNKTHPLSSDFDIYPYLYMKDKEVLCRCIVTYYKNDFNAYIGFFESVNNFEYVSNMFNEIINIIKKDNKYKLVGPLDASFWIKYRFKTNYFNSIYTGEPYNKDYYPLLWKNFGFKISDKYYSNQMRVPLKSDINLKCKKRLEDFLDKNYEIKTPNRDDFLFYLEEIYYLLIDLYKDFPGYKYITKEQFISLFKSLEKILDYSMVKLIYKENHLVAFFVSIPNYKNLTNHLSIKNLIKILKIKKNPREYILLYMGVNNKHLGLGSALAEIIKEELEKKGCSSIGALIHKGKVSGNYYKELIIDKYEYELYEKEI